MHNWISIADIRATGAQVKFFHSKSPEEQLYIRRQREKNNAARQAAEARQTNSDYRVPHINPWEYN
ncbi:hypothetical protein PP651_gp04 [Aeromonas phage ZPAH14]|uniref:Uncharacterized protein n=1 Tax=Aeromonas phage ZPAH14 TaxID=2924887 RepID=A0AAE9KJD3_9CAUD|nr:hypothetical protein PP651_gp04 [Aeromonas phage ZPAH14]UOT57996.1 hypothetical protein [Aeromonas phage ZPAH14]